ELDTITRLRQRYGLGTRVNGLAEDVHEAKRLISLGVGIGFLPVLAAEDLVRRDRLWPLLPHDVEPSYDIYLLSRQSSSARDTPTQLFLDEITRRLRARPQG
ncbi:LysR substrate-binding domain-containing protein, partial [Salmonella enterica]|uniref:LysR substrate-binding domain-containing protein n=1 Tax=Salmonella enterica TaxID=28901 RepID=UPI003D27B93B